MIPFIWNIQQSEIRRDRRQAGGGQGREGDMGSGCVTDTGFLRGECDALELEVLFAHLGVEGRGSPTC